MQLTVFMPQKVVKRKVKLLKETVPKSTVIETSFSFFAFHAMRESRYVFFLDICKFMHVTK